MPMGVLRTSSPAGTVGSESPAEAGGISPAGTVGCETPWTPWKPVRRVCAAAAEPGDTAVEPDAVCMTGMRAAHRRTAAAARGPTGVAPGRQDPAPSWNLLWGSASRPEIRRDPKRVHLITGTHTWCN